MTQTIDARPIAAQSPQERVDTWLADFEAALADRDIDRVVGKFATDSFWRDLVAFTWNIKTLEGPGAVAQMLTARLTDTDPSGFRTREAPRQRACVWEAATFANWRLPPRRPACWKLCRANLGLEALRIACWSTYPN